MSFCSGKYYFYAEYMRPLKISIIYPLISFVFEIGSNVAKVGQDFLYSQELL